MCLRSVSGAGVCISVYLYAGQWGWVTVHLSSCTAQGPLCVQRSGPHTPGSVLTLLLQVHPSTPDARFWCPWAPRSHPPPSHRALFREAGAAAL